MIPAIPEQGTLPDPPTCCTDVFDYAERLLAWIWTGDDDSPGIAECVGEDTSPCGTMVRYVSWGPPIVRPWATRNLLAVYLASPAASMRIPPGSGNSPAVQLAPVTDVFFGIELWEGCYPVPPDDGNGPSYVQWHEANRHAYAHGLALYNRLISGGTGNFSAMFPGCKTQRIEPLQVIAPGDPGLSVGWRTGLRVTW